MFVIYADGRELYNPALFDEKYQVINPELQFEVNKAGSLTFTMPPCNAMWGSIQKLTSVITVEQDGIEIFRGRVMNDETDTYKQRSVYCEGELAYLLDSIQRPYEFTGNAVDLFKQFITKHNESVNAEKQFTIGNITAVDTNKEAAIECDEHSDTFTEINDRLLNAYGGYIRVRHENGTRYIDYLSKAGNDNTQPIQLGVNLLDLKNNISADDVFTVLIPTGAMQKGADGKFTEALNISSVNDDKDYLEDAEGVARYGRIWRTKHWDYIEDPSKLKEKGQEYLETGIAEDATLTIKAVDMHFVDPDKQRIGIGDMVRILSSPHGLDRTTICYKMIVPLQEPDKTIYTFGEPKKTLTDNVVRVDQATGGGGGGGRTLEEKTEDIIRWAYAQADEDNARYAILTGELNTLTGDVSNANIRLDGVEATIQLKADKTETTELGKRLSSAEVAIDGANAAIALKADQSSVEELEGDLEGVTNRLSNAEVAIDGANAAIALKAEQSYVKDLDNRLGNIGDRVSAAEIAIDGANAAIALKASQEDVDDLGERLSKAEASIVINANGIESKVSKDGVISAINQTAESVKITASKIDLQGYVTASYLESNYVTAAQLEATNADISNLTSGLTTAAVLSANLVQGTQADITYLSAASFNLAHNLVSIYDISMGDVVASKVLGTDGSIDLAHSHAVTVNDDGTITLGEVSSTGGSFKIADTAYYKNGVSAAKESVTLSAPNGWQNGRYVVEASNGKTLAVDLPDFSVSGGDSFNASHKTTVYFSTGSVTGPLSSKEVDASSVYSSGLSDGASTVKLSSAGWVNGTYVVEATNGETLTVNLPPFTVSGGNYFDTAHKTTVYFFTDGVTGSLAKKEVDATSVYNTGVSAGSSSVTLSSAGWVNGSYVVNASNGKTLTVSLPEFTVSGGEIFDTSHKTTVYFFTDGVTGSLAKKEVDATAVYNTGRNSVTLSSAGWVNGSYVVKASNGKSMTVSLPAFTVSGGEIFDTKHLTTVYFFTDGVTGSLAKKEVDATPVYNTGWNECIAEAKSMGSWSNMCTISENSPGTLYMLVEGKYTSVGSSWVKVNTVSGTFYKLPATK